MRYDNEPKAPSALALMRQRIRRAVARRPALYRLTNTVRRNTLGLVAHGTDIVIEGYPRCGNSFAEAALTLCKPGLKLGHHRHASAQLLAGVQWHLPSVMLVRDPLDAVSSVLLRRPGSTTPREALRDYTSFYATLLPVIDELLVSDFRTTVQHVERLLTTIERRFVLGLDLEVATQDGFRDRAMALVNTISEARKGGAKVNYGVHLSEAERSARRDALARIRKQTEREGSRTI